MKYTQQRISRLLSAYERLNEHMSKVLEVAGIRGNIESIDYATNTTVKVTTMWFGRCGDFDQETHSIPMDWVTAETTEELIEKVEAVKEEEKRKIEERHKEEQRQRDERDKARELAELERLKAKYENNNQGE